MSSALTERLIAALTKCPCCSWPRTEINTADDGIPNGCIHESVFRCGGAVFVTASYKYRAGRPCPGPLEDAVDELLELVEQGEDADEEEGDEL